MTSAESRIRTVLLAQALESCDPKGDLLSLADRQAAALAAVQDLGEARTTSGAAFDDQLLAARASHMVELLASRHPALGSLQHPGKVVTWLAVAVPVMALLAGIFTERIANPSRVDLLSAPLLIIIGFNLLTYGLLAVVALRRKAPASAPLIPLLLQQIETRLSRQRGTRASVTAGFYRLWHALASHLIAYRWKTVLHLSAAAWGAGIALSVAGRGLFVQYKVGWESTFLGPETVHRLLEVIFWLPTTLFALTPLTLAEVAALRNFQTDGVAGDRWVWMYVGLTTLLVVLPRLLLAAWAAARARSASRQLRLDLAAPYFQAVLASMRRTRLKIGLVFADARMAEQFSSLARVLADDPLAQRLAISTPEADVLQWVEEPSQAVDCVLLIGTAQASGHPVPPAWSACPFVAIPEHRLTNAWQQGPVLMQAIATRLGTASDTGWERLASRLQQQQQLRIEQSMAAVAACLTRVAVQINGASQAAAINAAMDQLFLVLQQLHRLDRATGRAVEGTLVRHEGAPAATSKTAITTASAATGATMGAAVDVSVGFLTLGAGTALGALLGAGIGWFSAMRRKKGDHADLMRHFTEAALLLYLEFSNSVRVHAETSGFRDAWERELLKEIGQRKAALSRLWSAREGAATDAIATEAAPVLMATVQAVLATLYPPAVPVEVVGPGAEHS